MSIMSHIGGKSAFYSVFGIVNLAVGVTFYVIYGLHFAPPPELVAAATSRPLIIRKAQPIAAITGVPTRLAIPAIGVDLAVGVGSYNPVDGSWTLDAERAFYADESVPTNNNNGVTLVYGHAQQAVFGRLPESTDGTEATVYTDSGYVFRYVYTSRQDVAPTDTTILHSDGPPMLVLQTCSGPWDAYRTLLSFRFVSVGKS